MRRSIAFLAVGLVAGTLVGGIGGVALAGAGGPAGRGLATSGGINATHVSPDTAHVVLAATTPQSALDDLAVLDTMLTKAIAHAEKGASIATDVANMTHLKLSIVDDHMSALVDGVKGSLWFRYLECVDMQLLLARLTDAGTIFKALTPEDRKVAIASNLKDAESCKKKLEAYLKKAAHAARKVSIAEDDTWAHNAAIGKSNICINVRTSPAQAFVSGTLSGPGGYSAHLDKRPLDAPGSIQIKAPITVAGDYTKTLIVYDGMGTQTATVTKTFTVTPPPDDGPATTPACPKPTE